MINRFKARNIFLARLVFALLVFIFPAGKLAAQKIPPPPVGCTLNGTTPVLRGATGTYTLAQCNTATSWTVSCGVILSQTATSVTVYFSVLNCTSAVITAFNGATTVASKTVVVNNPPVLTGGTISNPTQTINYNTVPTLISASAATGGNCVDGYVYVWQSSPDGITFTNISGASAQNYQPPALTAPITYFRRQVICTPFSAFTTNTATVSVYPQIIGGTTAPASQAINYNTVPASLSLSGVSGGNGTYSYQWQNSPDGATYTSITGATATTYAPPALTASSWFRVVVTSNGASVNSAASTVTVYPQLQPGSISAAAQTINYNTVPASLALSGVSGGNAVYSYQWQSSPDNSTWTSISGATTTSYAPPSLVATTAYRVVVTSNGVNANSATATVTVYPQLQPGSVSPSSLTINFNTSPAAFSLAGVSGGNGTYSYQWQSSPDNSTWTNISGATANTYTSGNLIATTYFRATVTSNGVGASSAPATIIVNPQVSPGSIVPSSITISSGTSPGILSANAATGGACSGNFLYQWQSSPDNGTWTSIGGATATSYAPGNLTANIYYRRQVTCGTDIQYTNSCRITIGAISADLNFIRVRDITKPLVTDTTTAKNLTDPNDVKQTTRYFDGLGRPVQTVSRQVSPLQKDLVVPTVYDAFGREAIRYLPYIATSNDGNYKTGALGEQSAFNTAQFAGEQFYYGQTDYEASPLNRVNAMYAPGASWVGASRAVTSQYLYNTLSGDSVRTWIIADAPGSIPTTTAMYADGQLMKNITADEQSHQVVEYKDKSGKVVLKKVQFASSPGAAHMGWLNTYYVYDDLDNLRFVIQPQAVVALLAAGNWNLSALTNLAGELCFRYEYDDRKRMIIKKIPGAAEVWMVYDARDRLVMTQDANLRALGKWMVTKYDSENRPDTTGLLTDANNRTFHQGLASASASYPNTTTGFELLTQTFYDDYTWVAAKGTALTSAIDATYTGNATYFITGYNVSPVYAQPITPDYRTRGAVTGSMTKVIGTASQYLYGESFYDDRARAIQTQSINYTGGLDESNMQYDFTGKPLRSFVKQQKNGTNAQTHFLLSKMSYDAAGRLTTLFKNIDNATADQLIATNTYNELGQLQNKQLGNNLENLAYEYNIRGWLKTINKNYVAADNGTTYFGMELGYDKTTSVNTSTSYVNAQYNGNITGTIWRSAGDGVARKYDFVYDNVNRLQAANFLQNTSPSNWDNGYIDFSVSNLSYDANGNILTMNQKGFKVGGSALIDQLTYTYQANSNKLSIVTDGANDPNSKLGDFHYNGKHTLDYGYDGNGNLATDDNKLLSYTYNYLNLPQLVNIPAKGTITYTYDAAGNKLQKTTVDNTVTPAKTKVTTYIGGFVYEANTPAGGGALGPDTLQFTSHEEGRARWAFHKYLNGSTAYSYEYDYFVKDHLGNTRVVLSQQKDTALYLATMEAAFRNTEKQLFNNITNTGFARTSVAGYPNDISVTNPNDSVAKVNGSGQKTGPSILLKVMKGDKLDIAVQSYYNTGTNAAQNPSLTDVLNSLAGGIVTMAGGVKGAAADLNNTTTSPVYAALNSFLIGNDPNTGTTKPKAYLNWILLDEQLKYVNTSPQSGAVPVGAAGTLNTIGNTGIPITKSGYLYIWVSNETQGWDVFFDNLSVKHYTGPLVEDNAFYLFGLTMAGISSKALKPFYAENKYRFGDKELQNKEFSDGSGLEEYDFGARRQDPQLGVWHTIDPMAENNKRWTPYNYAYDNPIRFIDPDGMEAGDASWYYKDIDDAVKGEFRQILASVPNDGEWHTVGGGGDKGNKTSKGAWPIKNQWNDDYINKFRQTLGGALSAINSSDGTFTCDDLALQVIINFASKNNLPFTWQTGSGTFDASDPKFTNPADFLLAVKNHSGAPDFANNANTSQISLSGIQSGSLNVLTANGKGAPNHIQVISSVFSDGKSVADKSYQGVTGFAAAQGNFRGPVWIWNRYTGSDNPQSFRYLGVSMQSGIYDATTNTWMSPQKGTTTNFLGGHYSNQYRDFNFKGWNN